jgi:predicted AAA+ superfamily ATPase
MSWLEVLQATHVARFLRPFSGGGRRELLARPKIYGFDTGFVCHARGWDRLRPEDCGQLWEHLVLDTLLSIPLPRLHFWRDESGREIDFVIPQTRNRIDTIECKWNADAFEPDSLLRFRESYKTGRNIVVTANVTEPYTRRMKGFEIKFMSVNQLRQAVSAQG